MGWNVVWIAKFPKLQLELPILKLLENQRVAQWRNLKKRKWNKTTCKKRMGNWRGISSVWLMEAFSFEEGAIACAVRRSRRTNTNVIAERRRKQWATFMSGASSCRDVPEGITRKISTPSRNRGMFVWEYCFLPSTRDPATRIRRRAAASRRPRHLNLYSQVWIRHQPKRSMQLQEALFPSSLST